MLAKLQSGLKFRVEQTARALADRYVRPHIVPRTMPAACVRCGCLEAYPIDTPVKPDFDLATLGPRLQEAFRDQADGICRNCGLYQAYHRFSDEMLQAINGIGKDALTTEEAYHDYPVPESFIDAWYGDSVDQQRHRWTEVLAELGLRPKNILVMRYWFGRQFPMLVKALGADVSGIDISPICRRHVAEHYPFVRLVDGILNGVIAGEFLNGPTFDGVIVQHVLVHSVNVREMTKRLRHLVREGGFVLLCAETKVAPTNPFHKFYPSEYQIMSLLRDAFDEAYKLDRDGLIEQSDWQEFTGRAEEFIGVVRAASTRSEHI